jgi:hypothetical protein
MFESATFLRNKYFAIMHHFLGDPSKLLSLTSLEIIARSNEILGWEGVGNRQLLCFYKA